MKKKIISIIPFFIATVFLLYCWEKIIAGENGITFRYTITLVLMVANAVLYFTNYKWAILLTGIILLLASSNLLSFYVATDTINFTVFGIQTPDIQYWSFLQLIIYGVINYIMLVDWYLDYREGRQDAAERL